MIHALSILGNKKICLMMRTKDLVPIYSSKVYSNLYYRVVMVLFQSANALVRDDRLVLTRNTLRPDHIYLAK